MAKLIKTTPILLIVICAYLAGLVTQIIYSGATQSEHVARVPMVADPAEPSAFNNPAEKIYLDQSPTSRDSSFSANATRILRTENDLLKTERLKLSIAEWAEVAPVDALLFALTETQHDLVQTIAYVAGHNFNEAFLDWLNNHTNHALHSYCLHAYFQGAASASAAEALDLAKKVEQDTNKNAVTGVVIEEWARSDTKSALDWLDRQAPSAALRNWQQSVYQQLIEQSPTEAISHIATLAQSQQQQLIPSLAQSLAKRDIYEALNWAEQLPDELRVPAMATVVDAWAERDIPDAALDYLLSRKSLMNEPTILNAAVASLSNRTPDLLAERLEEFPNKLKLQVVNHVANGFLNRNTAEYETWLAQLPNGTLRDQANVAGINAKLQQNPEYAFRLAESLSDAHLRATQIENSVKHWASFNLEEALSALSLTDAITPNQKSLLSTKLENTY